MARRASLKALFSGDSRARGEQAMKGILTHLVIGSLCLVLVFSSVVPGPTTAARGNPLTGFMLLQRGQSVKGFFKGVDTKGTRWTVTIRPFNEKTLQTYPLSGNPYLAYDGRVIPWQSGVYIDSIVELLFDDGEVATINVLAWSS
jgi:hypothetical protein